MISHGSHLITTPHPRRTRSHNHESLRYHHTGFALYFQTYQFFGYTLIFRDSIACELNLTPHGWTDLAFLTKRRFWGLQMSTFNVEEQLHYERSRRYASIAYSLTPVFSLAGVNPSLDSKSGFEYLCGSAIILILLKSRI